MDTTRAAIQTLIDTYTPATLTDEQWASVGGEVRSWVTAAAPGHPHRARQLLAAAAQLACWCVDNSIPLQPDTALRSTTIERYCAVAERNRRHSTTSRATVRSRLRYIAAAHEIFGQPPPPPALRRGRVKPPYSAAEVSGFRNLVRGQPLETANRLELLLLAGLGAGCGSVELRTLHGTDVTRAAGGGVELRLTARLLRIVPVLDRYADRLYELAQLNGPGVLIGGTKPDRRAVASPLLHRIKGGNDLPPLEPGRLRSTWLAEHLRGGTRLDVLMAAAGLRTPTTIVDLAGFLDPLPAADVQAQLRHGGPPDQHVLRRAPGARQGGGCGCPHDPAANGRRA